MLATAHNIDTPVVGALFEIATPGPEAETEAMAEALEDTALEGTSEGSSVN
jgi:hypothetical protein